MNNNQDNVNVYIEFLLFTVILTTIMSLFYMPIFKDNHDTAVELYAFYSFLYSIKRLSASTLKNI